MPIRQFEPRRAVEVINRKISGSGYRIGGGLVLTAAHLVDDEGAYCKVRWYAQNSGFGEEKDKVESTAQVVWKAQNLDIALIKLPKAIAKIEPIILGKLPKGEKGETIKFQMAGYPRLAVIQEVANRVNFGGIINLGDSIFWLRIEDHLNSEYAASSIRKAINENLQKPKSEWAGMSGAAIICDGLVVAVQTQHLRPMQPNQVSAALLWIVSNDAQYEKWQHLLKEHGINPEPEIACIQTAEKPLEINWREICLSDPVPDLRFFQGRGAELLNLKTWLADITISIIGIKGEGGIGKSTLAAKAFTEYPGFTVKFWVDVRQGTSMTALAERALQELGIPPEQVKAIEEKELIPQLLRQLQQGRYLLAIDNLESVISVSGDLQSGYEIFFDGFQDLGSESVLLLASREYPAKYFGWKRSRWLAVEQGLEPLEGAALLKALEVEDTEEKRAEVSVQVQGNPLALSLIAGWLREEYRPGERLVESLKQHTDLLELEGRHRGETHISVEHVLQWSIDRLNPMQQNLLNQISVFRSAFNAEAATAVVIESTMERSVCDTDLDDLERRSLLQILPGRDKYGLRIYRLQPRIREVVQKQAKDLFSAHERAISYFWRHRQVQFSKDDTQEAVAEYEEVFYHQCQLGHYSQALATVRKCDTFLRQRGYYQTLLNLYSKLYIDWQPTQKQCRDYSVVCNNLGETYRVLAQYQQAIELYRQSLDIERQINNRQGEVAPLNNLGLAYKSLGQYKEAIDSYQQSLEIARDINDLGGAASSLGSLGNAHLLLGQYEKGIDFHQQSLEIKLGIGDLRGVANSLGSLGFAYKSLGQYEQAIDHHQQSLEIKRNILGDRLGEANSLIGLGNIRLRLGHYQEAIDFYQQALEVTRKIGVRPSEALSLGSLGNVHNLLGQYQQAIDFYRQALEIEHGIGDRQGKANSLTGLGNAYQSWGAQDKSLGRDQQAVNFQYQAIDLYKQALKIQREIGDQNGVGGNLCNLGNVHNFLGQYTEAIKFFQQALEIQRKVNNPDFESNSLLGLGIAYRNQGEHSLAKDFYEKALKLKCEIGDQWGKGACLLNLGDALAYLDRYYEALQSYQQALAIFEDLKIDYMIEKCKKAIAELNQIIAVEQHRAPSIGDENQGEADWWQKSLPTKETQVTSRLSKRPAWWQNATSWQQAGLWFAVGLVITLIIWLLQRS